MAEEYNHSRNDRGHSDGPRSGGFRSGGQHSGYRGKGGYKGHGSSDSRGGGYRGGSRSGGFRHGRDDFHGNRDRQEGQGGDRRRDDRQGSYRHNDHDRRDDRRSGYGDRRQDGNRRGGYQGRRNDGNGHGGYDHRRGYDRRDGDDRRDFRNRDNRDDRGGYRSDNRDRDGYRGRSDGRGGYGSNRGGGFHDRRQGQDRGYQRRDDRRQDDRRREDGHQGQDRRFERRDDRGGFRRDDNRGYSRGNDRRNDRRDDRHGNGRTYGRRDDNHQRRDDRGYQRRDDRYDNRRSGGYGEGRRDRNDDRRRDNGFDRHGDHRDQRGYNRRDDRGGNRGYDRRNDRGDNRRGFYQRDRHEGYDQARRNSDGTISYPSQNPYTDRRPGEPKMPKGLEWSMLSKDERERLRGLSKEHAENIGLHVLAAYALEESDPEGALDHAKWAARQASRIDLARETLALVAYRQGDYKLALKEFRTAYRMNGYQDYLPFIADCERGLGNARKAIEEATSEEAQRLTGESKVEMFLVYAGALGDLGLWDKAIETVQSLVKARGLSGDYRMRAVQAEQNFLDQAGRSEDALKLEPLLEKLEAQYADEEEDPDAPPKEILIDYDLEHLDDSMMEELSIDPSEGDYLDELDSQRSGAFVWGQDTVRPEVIPAQVGWIPSVIADQGKKQNDAELDGNPERLGATQAPIADEVLEDQASDDAGQMDQTWED